MEDKNSNIDKRIAAPTLENLLIDDVISMSDKKRFDKDKAYRYFLAQTGKVDKSTRSATILKILWQSAAAIAILVMVSYFSFRQGSEQLKNHLAEIVIEVPWGSRTKTYLPDGTLVWLNAGSKISYSQEFGMNEREVCLNGEGYFVVNRNEKLPFIVKTPELQVKVLGTKFNFQNYPGDKEATVSLIEGKVLAINQIHKEDGRLMATDQRIFLNKRNGEMHLDKVNAKNTAEWTNGYLFFDEELLPDIVKELERSYDVKIILTHPDLEQLRFYGSFIRKELSIDEVLETLSSTGKMKYRKNGKEISISR